MKTGFHAVYSKDFFHGIDQAKEHSFEFAQFDLGVPEFFLDELSFIISVFYALKFYILYSRWGSMFLIRFLINFLRPLFWLLFPYKAIGKENVPKEEDNIPLVMCSNHISNIDPIYLLMCNKRHIYFMAKAELFQSKLTNWFIGKKAKAFPVSRGKGDTSAIDTAGEIVKNNKILGIFPEGTRSKDGSLRRAKSGAALIASQTGGYILPVGLVTKGQKNRLFRKTYVIFGKPISPEEMKLDDKENPDLKYSSRRIMEEIGKLMEPYLR